MALSDEWEEVHLTPGGWVDGSHRLDNGDHKTVATPDDAVLTAYRRVVVSAIGVKPHITMEQTRLISDQARIDDLMEKFGLPTFMV